MKFILEVEVNKEELAKVNAARLNMGQQLITEREVVENLVGEALGAKVIASSNLIVPTDCGCRSIRIGEEIHVSIATNEVPHVE